MDYPKTIAIIGGGLGGLALAHGLRGHGYEVTIFERDASASSRSQGYHIGVNDDGAAALAATATSLPLAALFAAQRHVRKFTVLTRGLRLLCRLPFAGGLVDRWLLREALCEGLEGTIQWGKQFQRYEEHPDRVVVHFADGTSAEADLVVGADGARSGVRQQRCPALKYESVQVANTIGEVNELPPDSKWPRLHYHLSTGMVRLMGSTGSTVLLCKYRLPDGTHQAYWCLTESTPTDRTDLSEQELRAHALERCKDYDPEFEVLVRASTVVYAMRELHSTVPMKINPMGAPGRVTLLGDAAHAMTTHRGLGANTTFMDARDLADALRKRQGGWGDALANYERVLFKRGFSAVSQSRGSTKGITATGAGRAITTAIFWVVGWIFWCREKLRREQF